MGGTGVIHGFAAEWRWVFCTGIGAGVPGQCEVLWLRDVT